MMNLSVGTRLEHPKFGKGVIIDDSDVSTYNIYFEGEGEKEISKEFDGFIIVKMVERDEDAVSLEDVKKVIAKLVSPIVELQVPVGMGEKWKGGQLVMKPGREDLQSKSVPIDTFFHKIVMIRDRIRVMEQKINSSSISDQEKVDLQQYITRIYGSLTTFNVLFDDKADYFRGAGSK